MTNLFVVAAVILGADANAPLDLQQPVIAEQTETAEAYFGNTDSNKRIIKPVDFKAPSEGAPVYRLSDVQAASYQNSPSDSIMPPMPEAPKPISAQPMAQSIEQSSYHASQDYVTSCGSDTSCGCETGCSSCDTCSTCGPDCGCPSCCGYGHGHAGFWAKHCLPSPWHAPGNMLPHMPYEALPKTYYYFRPYNMIHIPNQQAQAASWVENPGLPYSNRIFDKVYADLEPELGRDRESVRGMPMR